MQRRDLPLEFVRVVEIAAIASAQTMGQGERKYSDHVAVEAMRREIESVDIDGTIVIGEGERAPASPTGIYLEACASSAMVFRTHCVVMTTRPHPVRFIDAIHPRESVATRFRF